MTGSAILKAVSEPIFSVPPVVSTILVVLGVIQAVQEFILPPWADIELLLWFAFIPARYEASGLFHGQFPGGLAAGVWTFVTYALLHGNWLHLGLNTVWFLAFGTPVARRFGTPRFLAFLAATAAAGAAAHLATHRGDPSPMIGASAAISGCMAAATRFVFHRRSQLGLFAGGQDAASTVPAIPLTQSLRDTRILAFLAVWFGLNLLFGASPLAAMADGQTVAWQAHVGGFVIGLLAFAAFDPIGRGRAERGDDTGTAATDRGSG
jgi:membrane associated rhomboid family serine protease